MANEATRQFRLRVGLLSSAGVAVVFGLGAPGVALAQDAAPQRAPAAAPQDESAAKPASDAGEIIVTGTRVVRDGYKAPTPTTVIGAAEISAKAPANIADFVNELPSVIANNTPRTNVGFISSGIVGINALNLRALGPNRTLILLDGQRVGAASVTGLVDLNQFPQSLIKRVDVVTGGASAGWGSDAVAGVVNFVLDKDFTGLKGEVQGGVTTYGDDRSYKVALAAGAKFADGRGHILLSGEIAHTDGITGIGDRKWYTGNKVFTNPAYNATTNNTVPALLTGPNVGFATLAPGGIITSGTLRGTYFGPGGMPAQLNYGLVGGNFMQGGDWQYTDFSLSGDLDPSLSRQNVFGRVSYDVSDRFQIFAQGQYGRAVASNASAAQFNFANITIQPDNAFIPASIASRVTAPFVMGTSNQDLGPIIASTKRTSWRGVIGASGDFDALGSNWTWDAYAQKSITTVDKSSRISINANYANAIDAVRNANGVIVCRSTLTNPTNGCVPYNVFGTGVVTEAAKSYVLGTAWGEDKLKQDVQAATLHGNPFSSWAGPVSVALGIEHRREAVSGTNDPLRQAALVAGKPAPYFAGNYTAVFGSYNVTEGFFEAVVPLAKDLPFARSLDFNGAVRATDYSTSGFVTTWKLGLTWTPVEGITFRGTRSRDIRAANLSELFTVGQTSSGTFLDPLRNNTSVTAFQVTSGNVNLKPEVADSIGLGVVLQPQFLPGFAMSVDYYNIDIKDAISTTTAQGAVNQCGLGNTQFCALITRDPNGPLINGLGPITAVGVVPVNLAKQINRGIDIEASYRTPAFGGSLSLRAVATRFLKNYSADGITPATDTVGTNGMNGTLKNSLPKWRYLATIAYDRDPILFSLTARGVSSGVLNTSWVECTSACPVSTTANMTINNNRVPGAIYFDTNFTVKLPHKAEAFLAIDNVLNTDPVQVAYGPSIGAAPISVNPLLYDVLGRTFRVGVRFKL